VASAANCKSLILRTLLLPWDIGQCVGCMERAYLTGGPHKMQDLEKSMAAKNKKTQMEIIREFWAWFVDNAKRLKFFMRTGISRL